MSENMEVSANPFGTKVATAAAGGVTESVIQREIAEVQAAVIMAKKFPRDPLAAVDRILQACARPTLAEDAQYQYAKGGQDISGPSIRLAEVIAQNWGNMIAGITILGSDAGKSECIAYAWDLETNFRDEKRFTVKHWRDTRQGGYAIKDEREIYELAANMGARRKRACILAVVPGDVIESAEKQCELTLKSKIEITPDFIKSVVASFEKFGVRQEHIEKRIQRRMDTLTPALAMQLKKIQNSIRDGMSEAADWFDFEPAEGQTESGRKKPGAKKDPAAAGTEGAGGTGTTVKGTDTGAQKPTTENAQPKIRNLFDPDGVSLGSGVADKVGDTVKIGIIPYKVLSMTANNATVELVPAELPQHVGAGTTGDHAGADPVAVSEPKITEAQVGNIKAKLTAVELTEAEFCKAFNVEKIDYLPARLMPIVRGWYGAPMDKPDLDFGK